MRKPKGWRSAEGVTKVVVSDRKPGFVKPFNMNGKQKASKHYEKVAQFYLKQCFGDNFYPSVWLKYVERRGQRWCECDGVMANKETKEVIIFEMKLKHTARAWWQLHKKYLPVLQFAFKDWHFRVVEMTNVHDPEIVYPDGVKIVYNLKDLAELPKTNIFIWREPRATTKRKF